MSGKFYYIREKDLNKLHKIFELKDPSKMLVLNTFGTLSDVAVYSPKFDTVVFTTVKNSTIKARL